jgi:hypothetical protein
LEEVECGVCGQKFSRSRGELKRSLRLGRPLFCSRSCAGRANLKNIPNETRVWGHLKQGSAADRYSPFRTSYRIARNRAHRVEREFTITLDDLVLQWERQRGKCPYTGWEMVLPKSSTAYNLMEKSSRNASIDRIDSSKGYVPGNIQFVALMANMAKNDFSHEEMEEFCWAIAQHLMGER